jgi:Rrf2 family nitric oxide-sensitive transcriptional repressor
MISQTADYALRAVVALALQQDHRLTTRELAGTTGIPVFYLAKVLQVLVQAGLVHSCRGTGGGFGLVGPLEEVTLLDVVNAVDLPRRRNGCLSVRPTQPCRLCGLHRRIDAGLSMAETLFACSTIAELVGDRDSGPPLCQAANLGTCSAPDQHR